MKELLRQSTDCLWKSRTTLDVSFEIRNKQNAITLVIFCFDTPQNVYLVFYKIKAKFKKNITEMPSET